MPYFACFRDCLTFTFRLDTRIYLRSGDEPGKHDRCIAAVIGKNPGSAAPTKLNRLAELSLEDDKFLPYVCNRFRDAFGVAKRQVKPGSYIRVWNLVYICNEKLSHAMRDLRSIHTPLWCDSERARPPIVWFAWGPRHAVLENYKRRFLRRRFFRTFYYDLHFLRSIPGPPDFQVGIRGRETASIIFGSKERNTDALQYSFWKSPSRNDLQFME